MSAATGLSHQGHIGYAANIGKWYCFALTSTQTLSYAYSADGSSWTTSGTTLTLANAHGSEGRNFGFGYLNTASTDIIHINSNYYLSTTEYVYHTRLTLSSTSFTVTNTETQLTSVGASSEIGQGGGNVGFDSGNRPVDVSGYLKFSTGVYGIGAATRATNTDTGSWTAGYGSVAELYYNNSYSVTSQWVGSLGSTNLIFLCDTPASTGTFNQLASATYTSGTWNASITLLASSVTASSTANWAKVAVSTSDIHVVALSNNSNTFVHRRFNGTSWSNGQSIPSLTLHSNSGLHLLSDGTNAWLFAIDSSNNVCYLKWTAATPAWDASWTTLDAGGTNARQYVTGGISSNGQTIVVGWTEANGTNWNVASAKLSSSVAGNASGSAPALSFTVPASSATGAASASGTGSALSFSVVAATATGAASATGTGPALSFSVPVTTYTASASVTGSAPSLNLSVVAGTLTYSASAVGTAPSLNLSVVAGTLTYSASVTGSAPALSASVDVGVATGGAVAAGSGPALSLSVPSGTALVPGAASGTAPALSLAVPTATATGDAAIDGLSSALSFSVPVGTAASGGFAGGVPGSLGFSVGSATATGSAAVSGIPPALAFAGVVGTLSYSASVSAASPSLGFTAPAGQAALGGSASGAPPALILGAPAGTVVLSTAGLAPSLSFTVSVATATGSAARGGWAPSLSFTVPRGRIGQPPPPPWQESGDYGTVICPWCYSVWKWYHPLDQLYQQTDLNGMCPTCGRAVEGLPASVRSLYLVGNYTNDPQPPVGYPRLIRLYASNSLSLLGVSVRS